MTTTIAKRCRCGAEMYAGPSGWVCSACDAPIIPFGGRVPKNAKRIEHDNAADPGPCEKCKGTGEIKCPECDGTGEIECFHCGGDMECDECDGDGVIECDEC